jgi:hypothetical protein
VLTSPAVAVISGEARLRETSHAEDIMRPVTGLFAAIAALTIFSTVAEAADGCGRGMYYNGRRCVPQDGPGYGPPPYRRDYGPPVDRGPQFRLDLSDRRDGGRYEPPRSPCLAASIICFASIVLTASALASA